MKKCRGLVLSIAITGFFLIISILSPTSVNALTIYATGDNGTSLVSIDTLTGVGTVIGPTGYANTYGAAFSPDGTLYTVVDSFNTSALLGIFDLTTGAVTTLGVALGVENMLSLEFASDGTLYGGIPYDSPGDPANGAFYSINTSTGEPTFIGSLGFPSAMDFAFDSSGALFATNSESLYTINLGTGAGTLVANITGVGVFIAPDEVDGDSAFTNSNMGIMFDDTDTLFATSYEPLSTSLYTIDTTTGVATEVGDTGLYFAHGGDIFLGERDSVPEPATLLLLGSGLFGFGLFRRMRG